jgi:glycosyltransferase involved in cell wall biosynthesis
LSSSAYASGLSIVVRAGFAKQLLIATDTPHMREVIRDGENGLLVRMGDIQHVVDTIRMIQHGAVDSQKLADVLEDDCQQSHTYEVMRQHIASMVDMCF